MRESISTRSSSAVTIASMTSFTATIKIKRQKLDGSNAEGFMLSSIKKNAVIVAYVKWKLLLDAPKDLVV